MEADDHNSYLVLHIHYISLKPYKKSLDRDVVLILQMRVLKLSVRVTDLPCQVQKAGRPQVQDTLLSLLVP